MPILEMIQRVDEFKLRVEYSHKNELVFPWGKTFPRTHWYTVISIPIPEPSKLETEMCHPDEPYKLKTELKKLSINFRNMQSEELKLLSGKCFINFINSGGSGSILTGQKKYMGDEKKVIMTNVNAQLIELGKKCMSITKARQWACS